METGPFEDVFPIKHGDLPVFLPILFSSKQTIRIPGPDVLSSFTWMTKKYLLEWSPTRWINVLCTNINENMKKTAEQREPNPYDVPLYWLIYRDPYIGLWKFPYNWVVVHPLYQTTNQGPLEHCSPGDSQKKGHMPPLPCFFESWAWTNMTSYV